MKHVLLAKYNDSSMPHSAFVFNNKDDAMFKFKEYLIGREESVETIEEALRINYFDDDETLTILASSN